MKYLKWFIAIVIFLMVGELMIRFDEKLQIFGSDNIIKIPTKIGSSEELTLLNANNIPLDDDILRIMVLGDSYINGGGIDFDKNFSHVLKQILVKSNIYNYKQIYILDVSCPSNNNLDNYKAYFKYVTQFKPQFVILGYNINDVDGNLDESDTLSVSLKYLKGDEKIAKAQKIYDLLYQSQLMQVTLHNLNKYLKGNGFIIPNSMFDLELKSYTLNRPNWIKSKKLLSELIKHADANNIKIIALLLPYLDLIQYPTLFSSTDSVITDYFKSFPNLNFLNVRETFTNKNADDYVLSKYDQHPNEKGHMQMAKSVYPIIDKNLKKNKLK